MLTNDRDSDSNTVLRVVTAGSLAGAYGTLSLTEDGAYRYVLDNDAQAVQGLAVGQTITDRFVYTVVDDAADPLAVSAELEVTIHGANDAPILAQPIPDRSGIEGQRFMFELPASTFVDIDQGDALTLAASLENGDALPDWLTFDPETGVFEGSPAVGTTGRYAIQVTATDASGASASGLFALTIEAGSEPGLSLTGAAGPDCLRGGAFDDVIDGLGGLDWLLGNGGNDTLPGGAGSDRLDGGQGADRLFSGEGMDSLFGDAGDDLLDGGSGVDFMLGGSGNDVYVVDHRLDIVLEGSHDGIDTVETSIDYTLGANLENLTLIGNASIDGTGNRLDNVLTGNDSDNRLQGGAGNDTLDGLGGADTLIGGVGSDTYRFGRGYGTDPVVEHDTIAGGTDTVRFLSEVSADQLWFSRTGSSNDLEISILGTTDTLTVKDWYVSDAHRVEQFITWDGRTLLDSQVENLVTAMAAFAPPPAGQTTLPPNYQDALDAVIAANWQ